MPTAGTTATASATLPRTFSSRVTPRGASSVKSPGQPPPSRKLPEGSCFKLSRRPTLPSTWSRQCGVGSVVSACKPIGAIGSATPTPAARAALQAPAASTTTSADSGPASVWTPVTRPPSAARAVTATPLRIVAPCRSAAAAKASVVSVGLAWPSSAE